MSNEFIRFDNTVEIVVRDKDGNIKHQSKKKNQVQDGGFDWIASLLGGAGTTSPAKYLGFTDDTKPAVTATKLTNEITDQGFVDGTDRFAMTYAHTDGTKVYTLTKTVTKTGETPQTVSCVGLYNTAPVANSTLMMCADFISDAILANAGDTLTTTWTVTLS